MAAAACHSRRSAVPVGSAAGGGRGARGEANGGPRDWEGRQGARRPCASRLSAEGDAPRCGAAAVRLRGGGGWPSRCYRQGSPGGAGRLGSAAFPRGPQVRRVVPVRRAGKGPLRRPPYRTLPSSPGASRKSQAWQGGNPTPEGAGPGRDGAGAFLTLFRCSVTAGPERRRREEPFLPHRAGRPRSEPCCGSPGPRVPHGEVTETRPRLERSICLQSCTGLT